MDCYAPGRTGCPGDSQLRRAVRLDQREAPASSRLDDLDGARVVVALADRAETPRQEVPGGQPRLRGTGRTRLCLPATSSEAVVALAPPAADGPERRNLARGGILSFIGAAFSAVFGF